MAKIRNTESRKTLLGTNQNLRKKKIVVIEVVTINELIIETLWITKIHYASTKTTRWDAAIG